MPHPAAALRYSMIAQQYDFIVVGAGIAGVAVAAELAAFGSVCVLEKESQPGYHATGRSAAFFAASYGNQVVRGITAAADSFYRQPPNEFSVRPFLSQRDCVFFAREDQLNSLQHMAEEMPHLAPITSESLQYRVPVFREDYLSGGLLDTSGGDLDVDAILQAYLRIFRSRNGSLLTSQEVISLSKCAGLWTVFTDTTEHSAPIVVNASGAWADALADMAGLSPLGIQPKRRTAVLIDLPNDSDAPSWPLSIDCEEQFYFKPEAGQLMVSPADETPVDAGDAQAEELDVAVAIDRLMNACDINVRKINHRWAGLRTFAPDKNFVVGFDPRTAGFFWLAGQGGYGVQSAPGLSQLSRQLITGATLDTGFEHVANYADDVSPSRLIH